MSDSDSLFSLDISTAVLRFLEADRPVWLESLGIVFPTTSSRTRVRPRGNRVSLRRVVETRIGFEKCDELRSRHYERFPGIVESAELATSVSSNGSASHRDLTRFLREVRSAAIEQGHSTMLGGLGTFVALRNQQGQSVAERYCSSELLLVSEHRWTKPLDEDRIFPREALRDAWEPFEAIEGRPVVALDQETCSAVFGEVMNDRIRLGSIERHDTGELILVTDGARHLSPTEKGTELIVRVSRKGEGVELKYEEALEVALTALALAVRLLSRAPEKMLPPGAWFASKHDLRPARRRRREPMTGIMVTKSRTLPYDQLADKPFHYATIVGLTECEIKGLDVLPVPVLYRLMRQRGCDEVINPFRRSILRSTYLIQQDTQQARVAR